MQIRPDKEWQIGLILKDLENETTNESNEMATRNNNKLNGRMNK
jgi:hypothetical protein